MADKFWKVSLNRAEQVELSKIIRAVGKDHVGTLGGMEQCLDVLRMFEEKGPRSIFRTRAEVVPNNELMAWKVDQQEWVGASATRDPFVVDLGTLRFMVGLFETAYKIHAIGVEQSEILIPVVRAMQAAVSGKGTEDMAEKYSPEVGSAEGE